MKQLWGLTEPEFIRFFLLLVVAPIVLSGLWQAALRLRAASRVKREIPSVYHLAYLSGGTRRVAETAVAQLIADECLRADSAGFLYATGKPAEREIERTVLDLVSNRTNVRAHHTFRGMRGALVTREIGDELARNGLVITAKRRRRVRLFAGWTTWLVAIFGLVAWVAGHLADHGDVLPAWMLLVGAAPAAASTWWITRPPPPVATGAGRALAEGYQGPLLAGAAGAVAVGGLAVYPDESLSEVLTLVSGAAGGSGGGGLNDYGLASDWYSCSCAGGTSGGCGGGCGGGGCGGGNN